MTREEALVKVKGYLTDLLPSEDYDEVEEIMLALEQTRWISVDTTNGDMIKAMFNPYKVCEYKYGVHVYITEEDFWKADFQMNFDENWWNALYKSESEGDG